MGLHQTKRLLHTQTLNLWENIHPTTWKKIFANHQPDKDLIFKTHKEYLQLNSKQNKKTDLENEQKIAGKDVEKLEPLFTVGGSIKWCYSYGNSMAIAQKMKNRSSI
jgi:hypothetical protein